MSEYRREDTASWDAQEVRRAQEGRQSAPARHPQSHHTRRRRRNPVLGLGGYLLFVLLASAILAGVGWMLGSDFCAFNRGAMEKATVEVTAEDSVSTVAEKLHDAGLTPRLRPSSSASPISISISVGRPACKSCAILQRPSPG